MKTAGMVLVCLVSSVVIANPAFAVLSGTIYISGDNNKLSGQANIRGGGDNGRFYTGIYSWTTSNATGTGTLVPNWGFCIDLPQRNINATYGVDSDIMNYPLPAAYGTPMSVERANLIRELWGRYYDPAWVTNPTLNNINLAGAFGCDIWEIIYETARDKKGKLILNISSGPGFTASNLSGGKKGLANSWLASLTGNGPLANGLLVVTSNTSQDFLVIPEPATTTVIPEPATITLLGLGVLAFLRKCKA